MKRWIFCLVPLAAAATDQAAVQQLFDAKLTPAQRASACFAVRGRSDPEAVEALGRALEDPGLLSCAAENLRLAGATEALQKALSSDTPQVRAAAARTLGSFQKPELLEPISRAAADENALVSLNAVAGLSRYDDPAVLPYLTALAKKGGMTGDLALERLSQLDSAGALRIARALLSSPQVPDKLYAMRVLGASGAASDIPELTKIAATNRETLSQRDRGFGFMPEINLSRAAEAAIAAIRARAK